MASSSVSQDDLVDNDFEKNCRRSRIRTARARQINPNVAPNGVVVTSANATNSQNAATTAQQGLNLPSGSTVYEDDCEDVASTIVNSASASNQPSNSASTAVSGFDNTDTSPKPILRTSKDTTMNKRTNKMHHVNKGKQQRDRRKLREKRRSTGVVHLASTESTTGGTTTGDDDESSTEVNIVTTTACSTNPTTVTSTSETKRNTQLNESLLHHHHHRKRHDSSEKDKSHHKMNCNTSNLFPPSSILRRNRDKSPSDMEADDENDHDSLNQSESSSNFSSSNHLPGLNLEKASKGVNGNRPNTPTCATETTHVMNEDLEKVVEENRRLLSLMEEKDKRIHLLETQIQQLMRDSK